MDSIEKWATIPGTNGFYEVCNDGRVRSVERRIIYKNGCIRVWPSKELIPYKGTNGYHHYTLKVAGVVIKKMGHRLVAEAFLPMVEGRMQVNHKDGNKLNNNANNLEWVSQFENVRHCFLSGNHKGVGRTHYKAKSITCNTGEIFGTLDEAGRALGLTRKQVYDRLKGNTVSGSMGLRYV